MDTGKKKSRATITAVHNEGGGDESGDDDEQQLQLSITKEVVMNLEIMMLKVKTMAYQVPHQVQVDLDQEMQNENYKIQLYQSPSHLVKSNQKDPNFRQSY